MRFILRGSPSRLLLITTGNIDNRQLEALLRAHLPEVARAFRRHGFVELGPGGIAVHD